MKNNTVTEVTTDAAWRNDLKPEGYTASRVIDIKFPRPCKVRGVDERSVEVEFPVIVGQSPFTEAFTKQVVESMGEVGADAFLDDMADYILRQFIVRNIR